MLKYNRNYNLRVMISVLQISILGAFIYDKLKITLTGNKSDSNKE